MEERRGSSFSRGKFPPWLLAVSSLVGFLLGVAASLALPSPISFAPESVGDGPFFGDSHLAGGPGAASPSLPATTTATTTTTLHSPPGQDSAPAARKGPLRVAICISGHIRSMVAPGIVERWKAYLLRKDKDVITDVYMIVKLGNDHHGDQSTRPPRNLTDPRLECPLAILKPYIKHFEVSGKGSDCTSVQTVWERLGMCRMPCLCCGSPYFFQVAGMHAVIHQARASGRANGIDYDFYVRLRPDTELKSPIQWSKLDSTKLIFQIRGAGTGHDHMFVVGRGGIDTAFQQIWEMYYHRPPCRIGAVDNQAFPHKGLQRICQVIPEHGGPWEMPIIHRGRELHCAKKANISALTVNDTSSKAYCRRLLKACGPGSEPRAP